MDEPVAWMYELDGGHRVFANDKNAEMTLKRKAIPLYTAPPRKEWVGLTDEEIDELHGSPMSLEHSNELKWVRIIEARLKDKNNAV